MPETPPAGSRGHPAPCADDEITVRLARPSEYAAVGELTEHAYAADGFDDPDSDYGAVLRDAATRGRQARLVVAVAGERLLGTVTYAVHGNPYADIALPGETEFRMLAVAPEARGHGIGKRLVAYVLRQARAEGAEAVVLSTAESMHAAYRIYERLGFVRVPHRDWAPAPSMPLRVYRLAMR